MRKPTAKVNGYKNWETFTIVLHVVNDPEAYKTYSQMKPTKLAENITADIIDNTCDPDSGYFCDMLAKDLLMGSMELVDWQEVYEALSDDKTQGQAI